MTPGVVEWLNSRARPAAVIGLDDAPLVFDFSAGSLELGEPLDALAVDRFSMLIERRMHAVGSRLAFGRWGEPRALYNNEHFADADGRRRTVHLGIDAFCAAGTPVHAPLAGSVQIVADNARELDYGPMLVLRHATPDGTPFFTLYGHLGPECLDTLEPGEAVAAGQPLATVGAPPGNGNWPPHLHLQLILDLRGLGRDFPGVAYADEQQRWLALSPSPACFFPQVAAAMLDGRK